MPVGLCLLVALAAPQLRVLEPPVWGGAVACIRPCGVLLSVAAGAGRVGPAQLGRAESAGRRGAVKVLAISPPLVWCAE